MAVDRSLGSAAFFAEMRPADTTLLRETPFEALQSFVTPTESHFVVAALGVPRRENAEWFVEVGGAVRRSARLSLAAVHALPSRSLTVTFECAGDPYRPDLPARRVSTARWRGAVLADIIDMAQPFAGASHVWIDGADWGIYRPGTPVAERATEYRKAITFQHALQRDVLLAYEMNGQPLAPEHGFPLRMIVPGFYGTNSVKWVNRLTVANGRPSSLFSSVLYVTAEKVDGVIERRPVAAMKVNSVLTSLKPGDVLSADKEQQLSGWAWGAHEVARVEVSVDGGRKWRDAKIAQRIDAAWQRFDLAWKPMKKGSFTIVVRASDRTGEIQPQELHINQMVSLTVTVI